jgi:hypothetical protein
MPTPSSEGLGDAEFPLITSNHALSSRLICPPEDPRSSADRDDREALNREDDSTAQTAFISPEATPSPTREQRLDSAVERTPSPEIHPKDLCVGDDGNLVEVLSPTSSIDESVDVENRSAQNIAGHHDDAEVSLFPPPSTRFMANSSSSFLRPGSKFKGEQKSDNARYGVQVEIQHIDMAESFLCGYLSIQGLTNSEHTLTTYFEGEIIGTKYTFQTRHADWGSNERVDMQHWARFPAWRPLSKQAKRSDFTYKNFAQRENIFMRWKEYFLVPDHTRKTINGASYEGFYYICFNQVSGTISGMYYHARTARYQKLELEHVNDHGCLGISEFR